MSPETVFCVHELDIFGNFAQELHIKRNGVRNNLTFSKTLRKPCMMRDVFLANPSNVFLKPCARITLLRKPCLREEMNSRKNEEFDEILRKNFCHDPWDMMSWT